ncbi:MAG: glucosaminidase domain-containing protein [Limosilactobacillus sp.]|uniref:glycoside hydrolase family 73 protein n=1 Tax=Limosilactobacillus sp. TaxID=2773925 RepID=UPI0027054D9D|nr:glucosaminidase domain-containing protein [Limosilactobacillus sp.]
MKKQLLTCVTTMILISNVMPVVAATRNVTDWAYQDALYDVMSGTPIDESRVRANGKGYTTAFLQAFAQVSATYQQAYRQGYSDGASGRTAETPSAQVERVAYQRGYENGQKLCDVSEKGAGPQDNLPSTNTDTDESPIDNSTYAPQEATPDQQKFIQRIAESAQKVGQAYDLYPSVIIAQAALESNWGASGLSAAPYHNLFGVKGSINGKSVKQPTLEYTADKKPIRIDDDFRWYDSDYQSLCDYAEVLKDPIYAGVHRSQSSDYRAATHALVGKYATDPDYDRKLNQLIQAYDLTQFDQAEKKPQTTVKKVTFKEPVHESSVHKVAESKPVKHKMTWLSVLGGMGSAVALGLLKRFNTL